MESDLGYVYRWYDGGDCGDPHWYRHPVLKTTPKFVSVGGWHDEKQKLNREALERDGKVWHGRTMYYSEAGRADFENGRS